VATDALKKAKAQKKALAAFKVETRHKTTSSV